MTERRQPLFRFPIRRVGLVLLLASSATSLVFADSAEEEGWWSLRPPRDTPGATLDSLVQAKLDEQGLVPNPEADSRTLLRRLHFDLVGLPPTPEAAEVFRIEDLERTVDALLAHPGFGERWGRHWLDAARYAESNGRDRNVIFHHAWRYRDYVIASFQRDKPYDVFVREQIAGDLLAGSDPARRDELLTATAFLALGAKAYEEQNPEIFRMDVVDEQIELIGRTLLGLSVACARCHDHKSDPIPTADYYALAGILRSTQPLYGYGPRGIRATAFHHTEWHALGNDPPETVAAALAYHRSLDAATLEMHEARSARYGISKRIPEMRRRLETISGEERDRLAAEIAQRDAEVADWNVKVAALEKAVEELKDGAPAQPAWTMGAREHERIADCPIHVRGETTNLAEPVPRGFLRAIPLAEVPRPGPEQSGRVELARWITHPDHPLPARVFVNRVWLKLFGAGLVTTPDDFGVNGAVPSHPELLDHLAIRFVEQEWSVKRLIREIVLSRTYRRSSDASPANLEVDPDNVLLWRMSPRVLEAEILRDAILSLSGQLDAAPPERPFLDRFHPMRDAELSTFKPFVTPADLVDTHRSVYLPVIRGTLPELLNLFDFASPDRPVAQREESTLPAQALHLMNHPWVVEQARLAAERLSREATTPTERIARLHALAFARPPTEEEAARAAWFVARPGGSSPEDRWTSLCQAILASAEFRLTR